jgi:hypothetical protein
MMRGTDTLLGADKGVGSMHCRAAGALITASVLAFAGCTDTAPDPPAIPSEPVTASASASTMHEALGCDLAIGANIDWAGWSGNTEQEALDALLADFRYVNATVPWHGPTPNGMGSLWLLYVEGDGYGTAVTFQQELDADGSAGWIATIDRLCDL